jgi:hypothetical protein
LKTVFFLAVVLSASILSGRRWAAAYMRYRVSHPQEPTVPVLQPAPPAPLVEEAAEDLRPKQPRAVLFRLAAPAAKTVLLGGSFNGFDAREAPMGRGADGAWETTLVLPPGRYYYKFKVDGKWELDPANPERKPAPREASVLEIK